MTPFALDSRLAADTLCVGQLDLCEVRLMNDRRFRWAILVPRRPRLCEIYELSRADRALLAEETALAAETLARLAGADKMNVGALGNEVRQLHIHVVARKVGDAAWPGPVWGAGAREPYPAGDGETFAVALAKALGLSANANAL
ncbi:MAG: HIT domain-containing protein [Alphaproteobacteria bacterium]|nr:HIT domain-containing protein [Alphaproteobacteria bacterium]